MANWKGKGGGRKAGQPRAERQGDWKGRGGGRAGSQPSIEEPAKSAGYGEARGGGKVKATKSEVKSRADGGETKYMDPEGNYFFALLVGKEEIAHFTECSGLKSSTEIFELQEGGMNGMVHKLPGQSKWDNITLRFGTTKDTTLVAWRYEVLADEFGEGSRRNASIVVLNNQRQVVRRYDLLDAWPVSWEGPSLSANGNELAVEAIELAHHGISISVG